jgi:osmotically-inducible protein OsmY
MANGPYSPSGDHNRGRDGRDQQRQASSDRPTDRSRVRGFADYPGEEGAGGRDDQDRFSYSRNGDADRFGRDDERRDDRYGGSDLSRGWARESYRADPSSFSYQPERTQSGAAGRERSGVGYASDWQGSDRDGGDHYRSDDRSSDRYRDSGRDSERDGRRGLIERASDEVASWFGDGQAGERRDMDQHRGKGPKGYKRSDTRIEEDINDRLSDDPMLDASNISVTVTEAEVTLEGFVSSRWDKRRAEDTVETISGVRHVQNNLRVHNGTSDAVGGSTTV